MLSQRSLLFRTGTLALVFCAILNGASPKRFRHTYTNFSPDRTTSRIEAAAAADEAGAAHTHRANYCTSCQRDSRGRILRSKEARRAFRAKNPCPTTRRTTGPCPGYVIDHIKALKHGGCDTPDNMQWQTREEAKAKDRVE